MGRRELSQWEFLHLLQHHDEAAGGRVVFRVRLLWGGVAFHGILIGSEAGSYLRLIHFVYHQTLGLRVIKKKKDDHSARTNCTALHRLFRGDRSTGGVSM